MSLSAAEHCLEDLPFKIYYVNDCWKANFLIIKCSFQGKKMGITMYLQMKETYTTFKWDENLQCFSL